jgi:hypothetical protein
VSSVVNPRAGVTEPASDRGRTVAIAAAFFALMACVGLLGTTAGADDRVALGGGAGIVVDGTYCTLTTIGHDRAGDLVGFTASTCGGPGAAVTAEGVADNVGTVGAADDGLDYAVIKFDRAKVIPIANFAGFLINGISPDLGSDQQPPCTQGGATGYACGSMKVRVKPTIGMARMPSWQPGDDGAPVTVDGQLIGMTRKGHTMAPLMVTDITMTVFSTILSDASAKGGPGAGFIPVPS